MALTSTSLAFFLSAFSLPHMDICTKEQLEDIPFDHYRDGLRTNLVSC